MKTVLLIDDDELILNTFGLALRKRGYRAITAESGDQGIILARQHLPDLIVSDINMPGTDGTGVLQALRADPQLSSKQIVLMTGNTAATTPRTGMNLGADDFLVKPFSLEEFMRCVEARLQRAQLNRRVEDRMLLDLRATLRSTLPHEFFTPLAGVLGLVDVLRSELPHLKPDEVREILDDIERSGQRLHRTLKNYLLALDLQADPAMRVSNFIPGEAIEPMLDAGVDPAAIRNRRRNDIKVTVEPGCIFGDATAFVTIVEELVENACNFSRPGTPVRIHFAANGVLTITDQGRGMSPDQLEEVGAFHQFDRRRFEQQGLGLGLVIVQKLAERCGAKFAITSEPGKGTKATATFRVADERSLAEGTPE